MPDFRGLLQQSLNTKDVEVEDRGAGSGIRLQDIISGILTPAGQRGGMVLLTCENIDGSTKRLFVLGHSRLGATEGHVLGKYCAMLDSITVTSPTALSDWTEGDNQNITWNYTGLVGATVAIKLSLDGGSTFPQTLATGLAIADQTWAWNPVEAGLAPGAVETDAVIRVEEE